MLGIQSGFSKQKAAQVLWSTIVDWCSKKQGKTSLVNMRLYTTEFECLNQLLQQYEQQVKLPSPASDSDKQASKQDGGDDDLLGTCMYHTKYVLMHYSK